MQNRRTKERDTIKSVVRLCREKGGSDVECFSAWPKDANVKSVKIDSNGDDRKYQTETSCIGFCAEHVEKAQPAGSLSFLNARFQQRWHGRQIKRVDH